MLTVLLGSGLSTKQIPGSQVPSKPSTLESCTTVPGMELAGHLRWGPGALVVPEYTFAVRIMDPKLRIGVEHTAYRWVDYETCRAMLHWDSNRNALHELNHRILHGMIPTVSP